MNMINEEEVHRQPAANNHDKSTGYEPDICDDDQMFTVSLMTAEVGEAHFHSQIYESRVFHLGLTEGWEFMGLCPFDGSPVA